MGYLSARPFRSALDKMRQRDVRWGDWAAPALILTTPFVNFLGFHDYGVLTPESLLAIAVLAGIGLLAGCAMTWRPRLLRPLLLALVLVIFIDVQSDLRVPIADFLHRHVPVEATTVHWQVVVVFGCFLPFFALVDALGDRAGTILATVFSVMLAATLLLPGDLKWEQGTTRPSYANAVAHAPRRPLPPIVHIVLDEQIGIDGLPPEIPGAPTLREELIDFYVGHGFQVFGKSFSRHITTENSLANAFNGEVRDRDMAFLAKSGQFYTMTENDWFDRLSAQGYQINVYQSLHLDFCADESHRIVFCTNSSFNDLLAIRDDRLNILDKLSFMFELFTRRSMLFQMGWVLKNDDFARPEGEALETDISALRTQPPSMAASLTVPLADRLIEDLRSAESGDAYFAHLLIPHRGFVLDETCRLKPDPDTWHDHSHRRNGPGERLSEAARSVLYLAYLEQIRCAHHLLDRVLAALSDAGVAQQAIIVVHGDHGSRIAGLYPTARNASRLEDRDLIDGFSTLFAIRSPGLEPGYDGRMRSVQALFAELVLARPIADEDDTVFLVPTVRAADMRLERHPMPGSWPSDRHSMTPQEGQD